MSAQTYVSMMDGGKTSTSGLMRWLRQLSANGQGPLATGTNGLMNVLQHAGTQNQSVDIQEGELIIAYSDYCFYSFLSGAVYNLAIAANTSGNPRIDCVVAYINLGSVSSSSNNNPGNLEFIDVQGTPAGSPSAPTGTVIQAAVGAGNPYIILANVAVANGFTQIVNANLSNAPSPFVIGSNPTYGWWLSDPVLIVANNYGANPVMKQAQTFQKIVAYAGTQPTGSGLTIQIYNVTQALVVGNLTISASSSQASTTSLTNPSVNAGDVLEINVTAIGSTIPGGDVTVEIF